MQPEAPSILPDELKIKLGLNETLVEALEEEEEQLAAKLLIGENKVPSSIADVKKILINRAAYEGGMATLCEIVAFPDWAQVHRKEAKAFLRRLTSLSLNENGRKAYDYFIQQREIQLTAAKGRADKKDFFREHSGVDRGVYTDEFLDMKREQHLAKARIFEASASIISQEIINLPHQPVEI